MERYQNNIQDQFGNAIGSVTVTVRLESSGALANIFSDNLGTPTAKSNPFTSAGDSELFFYAANERYDIFFTGPIVDQKDDVLLDDPDDVAVAQSLGPVNSYNFVYETSVAASPPSGAFRLNNGNFAGATAMYVNDVDSDSTDISAVLADMIYASSIRLYDPAVPGDYWIFTRETAAAPTDNGTYYTLPGLDLAFGETFPAIADQTPMVLEFRYDPVIDRPASTVTFGQVLYLDEGRYKGSSNTLVVDPRNGVSNGRIQSTATLGGQPQGAGFVMFAASAALQAVWYAEGATANEGHYGAVVANQGLGGDRFEWGYDSATTDRIFWMDETLNFNIDAGAGFFIEERGTAAADKAGFGQVWVENAIPNTLMYTDDAGGISNLSQPAVLFNAGNTIVSTLTDGIEVRGDSANDPTGGALQNTQIELANNAGAPVADIGFASVATFNISSRVHGAPIVLSAEDAAGTIRTIINADPDGVSSFRADTNLELLVNASESALLATANAGVALYWDNLEKFRTSDESASDIGMGAEVRHNDGNFYPTGMNVAPEDPGLDTGNVTLGQEHVGLMIHYNSATARSLLFNDVAALKVGAMFALMVGPTAGTLTGDGGTGVQIRWWNGTGWTTTAAAGNITIGVGQYTIWKETDTLYHISGPTLS